MANEAEELTGFLSCYDDEDGSEDKLLCYEFGLGKHVIGRSQETSNIVIQSSRSVTRNALLLKCKTLPFQNVV